MSVALAARVPQIGACFAAHRRLVLVGVYAALALLLAIPMVVATVPLGVDDLNHLARIHVLAHIDTDADLARIFEVRNEVVPYLGMDLLLTPLARVMPTLMVGRLYVVALVWGLVASVAVLQLAFTRRVGFAPAIAGLIAYNGVMAWGFLNYMLGLILMLLTFAAWHALRERSWPLRLVVFTGAATAIYLTHLLAFVMYGVVVASYELIGLPHPWRRPLGDWLVLGGQAVPALSLWHALDTTVPTDIPALYVPSAKVLALAAPFLFRGASGGFDLGAIGACFCSVALYVGLRRGLLTCPRTLAAPIAVLLGLGIVVPTIVFDTFFVDARLPLTAACLALAGVKPIGKSARFVRPIAAVLAVLIVAHIADVSALTIRCDRDYAEIRQAMAALPRGAELTPVLERDQPVPVVACTNLPIYDHMDQLVTIDRSGYAPDFFVRLKSVGVRSGRSADRDPVSAEKFAAAPGGGYVLWINLGHPRPVPSGLALLWHGSFFDLWAVQH